MRSCKQQTQGQWDRAVMTHPWLTWSLWQQGILGVREILSSGEEGLAVKLWSCVGADWPRQSEASVSSQN